MFGATPSLVLLLAVAPSVPGQDAEKEISRHVIILFDGSEGTADPRETSFHQFAEAPLHYLGLDTRWCDVNQGLPEESDLLELIIRH